MYNMIFVTEEEARNYFVAPNSKVLLMNRDKPYFYVKASDSLGQITFDTYSFKKVEPKQTITTDDLAAFKAEILALITPHAQSTSTTAQSAPQEVPIDGKSIEPTTTEW